MADVVEDRVISEEYKLWKKNNPFMYDFMMTRILEYPSPIVNWFEETEKIPDDPNDSILQRIMFGTITGFEEDNYLVVASVELPGYVEPPSKVDLYTMREDTFGKFHYYNDQLEADFKIYHNGNITSAKCMPGRNEIIASKSDSDLFIFDISNCLEDPNYAYDLKPTHHYYNLNSHSDLEWNPENNGQLLTTFDSTKLAIWDLNSQRKKKILVPKVKLGFEIDSMHEDIFIYDTSYHQKHSSVVGAVSSKGDIMIWDIRSGNTDEPSHHFIGHKGSSYQIKFNPFSEYVFITSGSDNQISVWDLRNLKIKLHSIQYRKENFQSLKWSPHYDSLFAATTSDRKVYLFDLDRIFDEQLPEEAEEAPSTLSFIHGGHTSKVYDFDWNPNETNPLMICSVSDDNVFQIWQMTSTFLIKDNLKADS